MSAGSGSAKKTSVSHLLLQLPLLNLGSELLMQMQTASNTDQISYHRILVHLHFHLVSPCLQPPHLPKHGIQTTTFSFSPQCYAYVNLKPNFSDQRMTV